MNSKSFIIASVFTFGLLPILALAQTTPLVYQPLVGIPNLVAQDFGSYINALYGLSIAIAALMAVIKIIIAGVKYMLSDVVTSKQEAIGDIRGSLLGLGVVISAVLVLTIINPQLTKTEIFMDPVALPTPVASGPTTIPQIQNGYPDATYTFRETHTDQSFKDGCNAVPGNVYGIASGGRYEVCYTELPQNVRNDLTALFGANNPKIYDIIARYKMAHRHRMIPLSNNALLTQIATAANSKNNSAGDVLLAVTYEETPTHFLDWIDAANASSIGDTCLEIQKAIVTLNTNPNTPITTKVKKVGSASLGYFACVLVPNN